MVLGTGIHTYSHTYIHTYIHTPEYTSSWGQKKEHDIETGSMKFEKEGQLTLGLRFLCCC